MPVPPRDFALAGRRKNVFVAIHQKVPCIWEAPLLFLVLLTRTKCPTCCKATFHFGRPPADEIVEPASSTINCGAGWLQPLLVCRSCFGSSRFAKTGSHIVYGCGAGQLHTLAMCLELGSAPHNSRHAPNAINCGAASSMELVPDVRRKPLDNAGASKVFSLALGARAIFRKEKVSFLGR